MRMQAIHPMSEEYADYLHDESRRPGQAESISFPRDEQELSRIVAELHRERIPFTVQGGRTGLACGAVPQNGHILNLSRLDRLLALRRDGDGVFYLTVEPGLTLADLRKMLDAKKLERTAFDAASQQAEKEFLNAPELFFSPDPTETSATIGGMAACNASGARSYLYGATRPYISALRVVLADGDILDLHRGQCRANGRRLELVTENKRHINVDIPGYTMPHTKNASGYYAADNMDAIDLFIGSDGTLGVISQLELKLSPWPAVVWGVTCFFRAEEQALDQVIAVRQAVGHIAAIEYFDQGAIRILRTGKAENAAFAGLPELPEQAQFAVYFELHCTDEASATDALFAIGQLMEQNGGQESDTWVARTTADRDRLQFFRHSAPELVNMLIDQRRRQHPTLAKLGTDMSVPDSRLRSVMQLYRDSLSRAGLESAIWGHIGSNHLHVNILPRDEADFARGKEVYEEWARAITAMGGAVSAEHGIGKVKAPYLEIMYGQNNVADMVRTKAELDDELLIGRGNLFSWDAVQNSKEVRD